MPLEKQANLSNFIGVYDNFISKEECDEVIKWYEQQHNFHNTLTRLQDENVPVTKKQDQLIFAQPTNFEIWWQDFKSVMTNFKSVLDHYVGETGIQEIYGTPLYFSQLRVQKTLPTQGYHIWHIEHAQGFHSEPRALAFTIYLNDVEEGGETEFLHFSKRVQPKTGRVVIWPAGFPYVHRGNPPLAGEKYILTSWMSLRNAL